MAVLISLGLSSGLVEVIGIGILIPIFSFVVNNGKIGNDFVSQTIFKFFSYFHISLSVYSLLSLAVVLFVVKALLSMLFSYVNVRIMSDYETRMKQNIYKNALSANWSHLLTQKIGFLERVLFNHVVFVTRLFQQIANDIFGFTSFIIYLFVAIKLSSYITFLTMVLGVFIIFIFKPLLLRTKIITDERRKAEDKINHLINENIVGIKTVKTMGVEKKVMAMADVLFQKLQETKIKINIYKSLGSSFIQPIGLLFIAIMFMIFFKRPGFDFAVFIAVMYLIQRIFQYAEKIQGSLYIISESAPYVTNLIYFKEELASHKEKYYGKEAFLFEKDIEVKDLYFEYLPQKPVLQGLNFKIKKGEMIGIIGPSGAGKTTLVDILLRLFEAQKGEILIDGKSVYDIALPRWRKNIGYVSQDIFLKNDTIRNNIIFYDENITDADVDRAVNFANAGGFIKDLPKGLDTIVGERGVLLSAGQRQRIVFARVLARSPKILILDEATSALDNESEKLIKESLDFLKGELTVIVIAHRLSTIMSADKLIAIEDGKVVEEGSPQELLRDKSSYFYKVYNIIK